jgi:hypothetical protein
LVQRDSYPGLLHPDILNIFDLGMDRQLGQCQYLEMFMLLTWAFVNSWHTLLVENPRISFEVRDGHYFVQKKLDNITLAL